MVRLIFASDLIRHFSVLVSRDVNDNIMFHQTDEEDYENSEFLDNIVGKDEDCEFHKTDFFVHFHNKKCILWQLQSVGILSAI